MDVGNECDGTAEVSLGRPNSQARTVTGRENSVFCSTDHTQHWQPDPVDAWSAEDGHRQQQLVERLMKPPEPYDAKASGLVVSEKSTRMRSVIPNLM